MPEELAFRIEDGPVAWLQASNDLRPGDWLLVVQRGEYQKAGFRVTADGPQFEGDAQFFCDGLAEAMRADYDAMHAENGRLRAVIELTLKRIENYQVYDKSAESMLRRALAGV